MRYASLLALAACFAGLACHQSKPSFDYDAGEPAPRVKPPPLCDGESYLEVQNRGNQSVDIYANVYSGGTVYVGTAAPSTARLSLMGTSVENKSASFFARVNGRDLPANTAAAVTITRRCDKRG